MAGLKGEGKILHMEVSLLRPVPVMMEGEIPNFFIPPSPAAYSKTQK